MSQVFANFVDKTGQHGPGNIQTKRVNHLISSQDVSNGGASVAVVFDVPFADASYTVFFTLELPTANDTPYAYYPSYINQKTASGFTANLGLDAAVLSGGGGDALVLHVVAVHD